MTIQIDKYRSLYTAKSLNGFVIVYRNTYKNIVTPFNKAMSFMMFKQEFEYIFPTLQLAENTLQKIKNLLKAKKVKKNT